MALSALSLAALLSSPADACGGPYTVSPEAAVQQVAEQHFAAIRDADRDTLRAIWLTRKGTVTHVSGSEQRTAPVRRAIDLWTAAPEPDASWEILSVKMIDADTSTVTARLLWSGAAYDEELTLIAHNGDWRLVAKTYSTDTPPAAASPYGG